MAKPMYMTDDVRRQLLEMFAEKLRKTTKIDDGKVTISQEFVWDGDEDRVSVKFTPNAFAKMVMLLQNFETEVAWHATVDRIGKAFVIDDIFVYPQEVSGATVNTDQEAYDKWTMTFDADQFNRMRAQGHSHVNMSVSPSAVDLTHQEKIVNMLTDQDFYIFMIWNKRLEWFMKVYDATTNTLYETADIDVGIVGQDFVGADFLKEAKERVVRKTYTSTYQGGSGYQSGAGYKGSCYQTGGYNAQGGRGSYPPAKNAAPKSAAQSAEDFLADVKDYDDFVFGTHQ